MKAKVLKEGKKVAVSKPTRACAGQKVSESWCTAQDDTCKTKRVCGKKCFTPVGV